ncbi:MAG TPA: hypothetical protein VF439_03010 [Candidatus Paceibacterota bacterium]
MNMGGMKEILTKARAGEPLNQDQQEAFAAVASAEERSHEDDSPVAFDHRHGDQFHWIDN